jgi:hypothetical protein
VFGKYAFQDACRIAFFTRPHTVLRIELAMMAQRLIAFLLTLWMLFATVAIGLVVIGMMIAWFL